MQCTCGHLLTLRHDHENHPSTEAPKEAATHLLKRQRVAEQNTRKGVRRQCHERVHWVNARHVSLLLQGINMAVKSQRQAVQTRSRCCVARSLEVSLQSRSCISMVIQSFKLHMHLGAKEPVKVLWGRRPWLPAE